MHFFINRDLEIFTLYKDWKLSTRMLPRSVKNRISIFQTSRDLLRSTQKSRKIFFTAHGYFEHCPKFAHLTRGKSFSNI